MQQNEVVNIFEDDFAFLGDDETATGARKENSISEYQSFTDLQHSKGKAVSAIHWLPHRKVSTHTLTSASGIWLTPLCAATLQPSETPCCHQRCCHYASMIYSMLWTPVEALMQVVSILDVTSRAVDIASNLLLSFIAELGNLPIARESSSRISSLWAP